VPLIKYHACKVFSSNSDWELKPHSAILEQEVAYLKETVAGALGYSDDVDFTITCKVLCLQSTRT